MISFTPFPVLTTERLVLRPITMADMDEFYMLKSDIRILEPYGAEPKTYEQAKDFLVRLNDAVSRNESIIWGIASKTNDRLIGTICYWNLNDEGTKAELGYELMVDEQGKGYMQEAIQAVIDYGFDEMKLERIEAVPIENNAPSIKVLERTHFKRGDTFTEENSDGTTLTLVCFFMNHERRVKQ